MIIGALGDIPFQASSEAMQSFEDMKRKTKVSYATHKLHGKKSILEMTGFEPDETTFTMTLSAFLGINPDKALNALEKYQKKGNVLRLVVGTRTVGSSWVITDLTEAFEQLYSDGRLITMKVDVTLMEYGE